MKEDQKFWNNRYLKHETGWDAGGATPVIAQYTDRITDKNMAILIPGCGNAYEADYLLSKGFTNITVLDISDVVLQGVKEKLEARYGDNVSVLNEDFFDHTGAVSYTHLTLPTRG